jgi:FkbM family methyltransferase
LTEVRVEKSEVMIVRHFDISTPKNQPPQGDGWEQAWYGYYRTTKCWKRLRVEVEENIKAVRDKGELDELHFEQDCFLSVLADINKKHVNMLELGAGWGEWCLALAGVIDYRIIPIKPVSYRCLAVEGDPTHLKWLKEHFESQNINGIIVHGAVSDKNGTCRFSIHHAPDACYGQAMVPQSKPSIRGAVRSLYNFMSGEKTIEIPAYTVDELIKMHGFEHVDIIDMDVQGAEYQVLLGATQSINHCKIDYLIIGTHSRELNDQLREFLSPKFNLIIDIYPNSVGIVDGFPPIRCQDGMQIYKRKNI